MAGSPPSPRTLQDTWNPASSRQRRRLSAPGLHVLDQPDVQVVGHVAAPVTHQQQDLIFLHRAGLSQDIRHSGQVPVVPQQGQTRRQKPRFEAVLNCSPSAEQKKGRGGHIVLHALFFT